MRLQLQHKRDKRLRVDDDEVGDPGPATLAHRARAAEFTPPRKKLRELVSPSPDSDDDEVESLASQASSTRKKVQPKFVFVDSKDTPKCNQSEIRVWMQTFAIEQMNKAGPYIDKKPKETDLGGMKLAHVSLLFPFLCFCCSCSPRCSPTSRLQAYRSRVEGGFVREQYHCPFRKKCGCLFAISVKTFPDRVMLFVSGEHNSDSHKGGPPCGQCEP